MSAPYIEEAKLTRKYPPAQFGPSGNEDANVSLEDYIEVGKVIVEWSTGVRNWPRSIDEFNQAVGKHYTLPPGVKAIQVVQGNDEVFVLRLPARNQVAESDCLASQGAYDIPPVVDLLANRPAGHTVQDFFHARVADYTMRQCR